MKLLLTGFLCGSRKESWELRKALKWAEREDSCSRPETPAAAARARANTTKSCGRRTGASTPSRLGLVHYSGLKMLGSVFDLRNLLLPEVNYAIPDRTSRAECMKGIGKRCRGWVRSQEDHGGESALWLEQCIGTAWSNCKRVGRMCLAQVVGSGT